jgi:DeoR/GlpR family transcriptional regulator of sugar metabolism
MDKQNRLDTIYQACKEKGDLTFEDARDLLPGVSDENLRRDFRDIASQHPQIEWLPGRRGQTGKIQWNSQGEFDPSYRSALDSDEKRKMAEVAARLVGTTRTIFIDSGSTQKLLVEYLIERDLLKRLDRIYTTCLETALKIAKWQKEEGIVELVHVIGGPVRPVSRDVTGTEGWKAFPREIMFDMAIMGTPGIDHFGLLSRDQAGVDTKLAAINRSHVVLILADPIKFDQEKITDLFRDTARSYVARFDGQQPSCKGFYLVSSDRLSKEDRERLEAAGITVYTNTTPPDQIRLPSRIYF